MVNYKISNINTSFYKNLVVHKTKLKKLLKNEQLFTKVPEDWFIIITDIKNSSIVIERGLHNEVNLAATGSIVAVLNYIKTNKLPEVPYFYGGDGVTFLIPGNVHQSILGVLNTHQRHIKQSFNLDLRVGEIQVKDIFKANQKLVIGKIKLNKYLTIPIVLGNGLKYAEHVIKKEYYLHEDNKSNLHVVNLEGMECRWNEIEPPKSIQKVICLLINCSNDQIQSDVYQQIISEIEIIFGDLNKRKPISVEKLKLDATIPKIRKEMYARIGKYNFGYMIKNWLITNIGRFYFKYFKEGKEYVYKVSQLSDTIMIDGTINTVITGEQYQIDKLVSFLDTLESKNTITYGIHTTHGCVMSCYVENRKNKHIHFVDGTEGGYTSAARVFKSKHKEFTAINKFT